MSFRKNQNGFAFIALTVLLSLDVYGQTVMEEECRTSNNGNCASAGTGTKTGTASLLNAKVIPLAFGRVDFHKSIINLTAGEFQTPTSEVILDDFRTGFQVTKMKTYQVGLGVASESALKAITGFLSETAGVIGLAVVKNKMVKYERFVETQEEAINIIDLQIPFTKEVLDSYAPRESVYFENIGGFLFMGGVNTGGLFTGGSVIAEGGFKTLIVKVDNNNVVVQITKTNINKATLFTGMAVVKLNAALAKDLNEGFSYSFDLSSKEAMNAYENLLAGNAIPSQELAGRGAFTGVTKLETFNSSQFLRSRGITFRIPILFNYNWSTGKTYGQIETFYGADNSKSEMNYGIYFKEHKGRFLRNHKNLVRTFYSGKAINTSADGALTSEHQMANYFWSYENDWASGSTLIEALKRFQNDTGLKSVFNPLIPEYEGLGFVRLEAQLNIPESYTNKLIASMSQPGFSKSVSGQAMDLIGKYFRYGDQDELCVDENLKSPGDLRECRSHFTRETIRSLEATKNLLNDMKRAKDPAAFTSLHALIGKEMIKNQFILGTILSLDAGCDLTFNTKLEGQRISHFVKNFAANPNCR